MKNPFVDDDFLKQLHEYPEREIYAKVVSLDLDENPIEEITGHVTQGTISIDGTSAVRRTCSLTMVADEIDINSYYWGLNTKIKLYVGLRNFINPEYDDIIWFPQGIYILTTFSTAQNVTNYTINLQGKDKMACLNGELGGVITALSVDFGKIDEEDVDVDGNGLGTYSSRSFYLKDIITEAVHNYADEPYANIYVRDLDELGLELFEYRGDKPLYTVINCDTNEVEEFTLDGSTKMHFYDENGNDNYVILDEIKEQDLDPRMTTVSYGADGTDPKIFYTKVDGELIPHSISKIIQGDGVGYKVTNLIFAGDLIATVGQNIANAVLDPIVKQLGDFEYFYDDEGKFVFQQKRTFVNTSWNNLEKDPEGDTYAQAAASTSTHTYSFDNSYLIQTFNNTPALNNVKNDFAVWGERQGVGKDKIPIHMRYAIDKKPKYYTSIGGITYTTRSEEEVEQDQKTYETEFQGGYQKEPSRFGLSEDWWEVRDWANAWLYSGLSVPTEWLGYYCPVKAVVEVFGRNSNTTSGNPIECISMETYELWGSKIPNYPTDDLVFDENGKLIGYHGECAHAYTEWLGYFEQGGWYEGGYAYFYKPQIPDSAKKEQNIQLKLGNTIYYNLDWRELIYQMALDYLQYGTEDDFLARIREANPIFYPAGYTNYEHYYTDLEGFWRELYDPHLANAELAQYEKVKISSTDDYALLKTLLYEKRDSQYIKVNSLNPYNSKIQYYKKNSEDRAEEHPYTTYYQQTGDGTYIALTENDVTILNKVDYNTKYYYKVGNEYFSYHNYNNNERYYSHHVYKELATLDPFETYYVYSSNIQNPYTPYNNYESIYIIAKSFDETETYYLYEADTGKYIPQEGLTGFAPKQTYYVLKNFPIVISYFLTWGTTGFKIEYGSTPILAYKGYQLAEKIIPGYTYYTKDFDLVPVEDSDQYTYEYKYIESFKILENTTYCYKINDIEYETTTFSKGMTYYPKGHEEKSFTIPRLNLYYCMGINGYQSIPYKVPLKIADRSYYFDDNNKQHFLPAGCALIGRPTYYYKDETAYQLAHDFEEGDLYVNQNGSFRQYRILKEFNKNKQYYVSDGDEYILSSGRYQKNTTYYLSEVDSSTGKVVAYIKYSDFLDFSKPISGLSLYIIDDLNLYTTSHVQAKDGITNITHNFAAIDRNNAQYNPELDYYLYAVDENFYPIYKQINEENWDSNAWSLYVKNINNIYTLAKHISYAPEGTIINKDGQQITLTHNYSISPDYHSSTFWTFKTEKPEELNFWFDFLDTEGELSQYANYVIGNRPKAENDTKVNAIYYRDTPNVIFVDSTISDEDYLEQKLQKPGYAFMKLNNSIKSLFNISAQGKTAQAKIDALLYSNTYCTEVISITCLPVYHLKPNTRIFIKDDNSGINGEYIITKISSPLTFNGMMTISAAKAVERIY